MTTGPTPRVAYQISVLPGDVVRIRWTPGLQITASLAAAAMAEVDKLNEVRKRPLLVEMTGAVTPAPGAREQWGQRSSVTRIALLGESAVDRVHASFGPRIGGPGHPVPTQFFTSEAAALDWLRES